MVFTPHEAKVCRLKGTSMVPHKCSKGLNINKLLKECRINLILSHLSTEEMLSTGMLKRGRLDNIPVHVQVVHLSRPNVDFKPCSAKARVSHRDRTIL
jgi:hypothetical protein